MDPETRGRHHQRLTSGQDTRSARCGESRTPGAGGGPRETTGGDTGTAPAGLPHDRAARGEVRAPRRRPVHRADLPVASPAWSARSTPPGSPPASWSAPSPARRPAWPPRPARAPRRAARPAQGDLLHRRPPRRRHRRPRRHRHRQPARPAHHRPAQGSPPRPGEAPHRRRPGGHRARKTKARQAFPATGRGTPTRKAPPASPSAAPSPPEHQAPPAPRTLKPPDRGTGRRPGTTSGPHPYATNTITVRDPPQPPRPARHKPRNRSSTWH